MTESAPPTVNMLWIGQSLGPNEQLSIVSFLAAGHPVHLHSYDEVKGVPAGTAIQDAERTLPRRLLSGLVLDGQTRPSHALASDYFRMLLQKRRAGLWADCDMVCLEPVHPSKPHLFGYEAHGMINGAILVLPPEGPVLTDILDVIERRRPPYWANPTRRIEIWLRYRFGVAYRPKWGMFGPIALNAAAARHKVAREAEPFDVFYPIQSNQARSMYEPGSAIDPFITERTKTVHLFNEMLGELKGQRAPASSGVGRLLARFGI